MSSSAQHVCRLCAQPGLPQELVVIILEYVSTVRNLASLACSCPMVEHILCREENQRILRKLCKNVVSSLSFEDVVATITSGRLISQIDLGSGGDIHRQLRTSLYALRLKQFGVSSMADVLDMRIEHFHSIVMSDRNVTLLSHVPLSEFQASLADTDARVKAAEDRAKAAEAAAEAAKAEAEVAKAEAEAAKARAAATAEAAKAEAEVAKARAEKLDNQLQLFLVRIIELEIELKQLSQSHERRHSADSLPMRSPCSTRSGSSKMALLRRKEIATIAE